MTPERKEIGALLDTLLKPLIFASKDSFAHLHTIRDLEPFITGTCNKVGSLSLPPLCKDIVKDLRTNFKGFDLLPLPEKKERIIKGLSLADSLKKESPILQVEAAGSSYTHPFIDIQESLSIFSTPVEEIKGIGAEIAKGLKKKGISTLEGLLYFIPVRYEDRRRIKSISQLVVGEKAVLTGEVMLLDEVFYGRKRVFEMVIGDGRGIIKAKWFNFNRRMMQSRFKKGQRVILFGEISVFGYQKEVLHPDIEVFKEGEGGSIHFNGILPVYSQVEKVHQKRMRGIMKGIVEKYLHYIPQSIPESFILRYNLMGMDKAIHEVHFPENDLILSRNSPAFKTLIFDEFFYLELGLAMKRNLKRYEKGPSLKVPPILEGFLRDTLPFSLTKAQERALEDIKGDMSSPHPMNRLLQGDVGSGKTVVAFLAALIAVGNGYQSAIMVPTEILAGQHYRNIKNYSSELGLKVALLTSSMGKKEKNSVYNAIREKDVDIIIGTHAIIQEGVEFNNLGLVVVDEQHRFGVMQRASLKGKGCNPHVLVMTATPIPRTLAMTVFGDLDVSIIDELPPGRIPVTTRVFREQDRAQVYSLLERELKKGRQAYIVYPLVEESEELDLKDATNMSEHLKKDIFPDYRVALLHGRMKGEEKAQIMETFKDGEIDILVATTVIEVGVDIPNAAVMLIEHVERFGLAQLHQLRGRVGRGEHGACCLLMASKIGSKDAYRRLKVMESTTNGFRIAEEDLKIRGPGDFLGIRQSGLPDFKVASLIEDISILQRARDEAFKLIRRDPELDREENQQFKEILKARWKGRLELARVG
ncbi:MAG: ATP-dependent DNA helicase RecG [Thermodesulfobacteriota bacterium]